MDFFEAQDRARRRTNRLVVLFVFAVLGTIVASYGAARVLVGEIDSRRDQSYDRYGQQIDHRSYRPLFDRELFAYVAGATIIVVGVASLFKWATMRQGGGAIAESVGARRVDPQTTNLH